MGSMYVRVKCVICEREFAQEKKLVEHLISEHNVSDQEQLYIDHFCDGVFPTCQCGVECKERLKWYGWKKGYVSKFSRGHNAVVASSFNNKELQKQLALKRTEGYASGSYVVWNKGLTKDTSQKLAEAAEKTSKTLRQKYVDGSISSWQTGLTKDDCESLRKASETHIEAYRSGRTTPWSKGLTKEIDERLARFSEKLVEHKRTNYEACGARLPIQIIEQRITDACGDTLQLLTSTSEYRNNKQLLTFKCNLCGCTFEQSMCSLEYYKKCLLCNPPQIGTSVPQSEIEEFVRSITDKQVIARDRKVIAPLELDVYVPELSFAIEHNGLYWHSLNVLKDKNYHDTKTKLAAERGVRLLHVFEDEWRDKRDIVKSMIRNAMHLNAAKLHARKCVCKEIDVDTRRAFFEATHLDGDVKASRAWGLFHGDVLVCAISVRRPHHKKYENFVEIARFSSALNMNVVGGLSKLLSAVRAWCLSNGIAGVLTYLDTRLGTGVGYEATGFALDHVTAPRFWWTDTAQRFDRFKFRANSVSQLTQENVASLAGVTQIYGCSNRAYVSYL